jgi:hypothetical protein
MWSTCPREMLLLRHFTVKLMSHILVTWRVRTTLWSKKLYHAGWDGEVFVDPQIWSLWQLTSRSSEKIRRHFRASVFQFLLTFSGKVLVLARCCSCKMWAFTANHYRRARQFFEANSTSLHWCLWVVLEVLGYTLRSKGDATLSVLFANTAISNYVIPSYAMSDLNN